MVEGNSLENCHTRKGIVSSNLTSSARKIIVVVLPPPGAGSRSSGKNYRTERYRGSESLSASGGSLPPPKIEIEV